MDNKVEYLEDRNCLLVEIANGFHAKLQKYSYDLGGSTADLAEDALVDVLNGYAYDGRVEWDCSTRRYYFDYFTTLVKDGRKV